MIDVSKSHMTKFDIEYVMGWSIGILVVQIDCVGRQFQSYLLLRFILGMDGAKIGYNYISNVR